MVVVVSRWRRIQMAVLNIAWQQFSLNGAIVIVRLYLCLLLQIKPGCLGSCGEGQFFRALPKPHQRMTRAT